MKMTKVLLCIIVGLVSLVPYNTMAVDIFHLPMTCRAVRIVNYGEPNSKQCLDFNTPPLMKDLNHYDFPAQLSPCTNERLNQLWVLSPNGFIRSPGNLCLVFDPFVNSKIPATVKDCDKSSDEEKKWTILLDGTIVHDMSRQVLTPSMAIPHPFVILEANMHAPSQKWEILPYLN